MHFESKELNIAERWDCAVPPADVSLGIYGIHRGFGSVLFSSHHPEKSLLLLLTLSSPKGEEAHPPQGAALQHPHHLPARPNHALRSPSASFQSLDFICALSALATRRSAVVSSALSPHANTVS